MKEYILEVNENISITVKEKKYKLKGFGSETLVLALAFMLGGIAGGILEEIGSDIWTAIKGEALKLFKKKKKEKKGGSIKFLNMIVFQYKDVEIYASFEIQDGDYTIGEIEDQLTSFLAQIPKKLTELKNNFDNLPKKKGIKSIELKYLLKSYSWTINNHPKKLKI